jgi:hypothetical protein
MIHASSCVPLLLSSGLPDKAASPLPPTGLVASARWITTPAEASTDHEETPWVFGAAKRLNAKVEAVFRRILVSMKSGAVMAAEII